MPQVIELKGGELVTPLTVFDAMDIVEEYLGTDMRQFLEDFFEDEVMLPPDEELIREHYAQVLMNIEDVLQGVLRARRMTRKLVTERITKIQDIIRREAK